MRDIEIREIVVEDLTKVVEGLIDIEGSRPDINIEKKRLKWWFFDNPVGLGVFAGAYDGSKLVGICGIIPKNFIIDNCPVVGAEIVRGTVHPDYRGKRIFSSIVKYLITQAKIRDYKIMYATPNLNSGPIFLSRRLGFFSLFHWNRLGRPIKWTKVFPERLKAIKAFLPLIKSVYNYLYPLRLENYKFTVTDTVKPELEQFLRKACNNKRCLLLRDSKYLTWRYNRPGIVYHHLYLFDEQEQLCGWAVFRVIVRETGNVSRIRVGDFWVYPQNKHTVRALVAGLASEGKKYETDILYISTRSNETTSILKGLGFHGKLSIMPLIAYMPKNSSRIPYEEWEYRESDADMF